MEVRCEPATRPCKPEPLRLRGERLDVPGQRIVGFIAMQVDAQAALGGDLAQGAHRRRAVRHRALEMRDAADHLDAAIERPREVLDRARRAVEAVLRERDQLEIEIRRHAPLHLEERTHGEEPVVADVDMGADGEQSLRDREVAIAQGALDHRLVRQEGLQLAPERDAFEERAGLVEARLAERERRVHMEMGIDERRRDEMAGGVQHRCCASVERGADGGDPSGANDDILAGAAVGQGGVADDQVVAHGHSTLSAHRCPLKYGTIRALG